MTKTCICDAADLRRAILVAKSATMRRSTIPILGRVLIAAGAGKITVSGCDLDKWIDTWIAAETGPAFAFTADPGGMLTMLHDAAGSATITQHDNVTTIAADSVEMRFRDLCDPIDWPQRPNADGVGQGFGDCEIAEAALHRALSIAMICVSAEETRYYLNGVYFESVDAALRLVSTDGHRAAIHDTTAPSLLPAFILPRQAAGLLASQLRAGGNGIVRFEALGTAQGAPVHISSAEWTITAKTIDGKFPGYRRILATGPATITATVTAQALRRLPAMFHRCATLDPEAGRITVHDPQGDVTISAPIEGKGQTIGFNPRFLLAFAAIDGAIRIEAESPSSPANIVIEDPATRLILMPMRT